MKESNHNQPPIIQERHYSPPPQQPPIIETRVVYQERPEVYNPHAINYRPNNLGTINRKSQDIY